VAVIGGGVSGLTAAALLSRAGLHTVVFEAQNQPGGYVAGFRRGPFQFDTSIQWLNAFKPGGFAHRILACACGEAPDCPPLGRIWRFTGEGVDYLLTSRPLDLRDRLRADFPASAAGIEALFRDARRIAARLAQLDTRVRAGETMPSPERIVFGLRMLEWALSMRRFLGVSAERGLARYDPHGDLRRVFCTAGTFMAVAVPLAWAMNNDYQRPPAGGGAAIVQWLCRHIEAAGSRVLTRHPVEGVRLDRGRAAGVVLAGDRVVRARYVVAACDVQTLYERLLPEGCVSRGFLRRLRAGQAYYSSFTAFLGLDCDPRALGFNEEMVSVPCPNQPRADHAGRDPRKAVLSVIAPSVRDPSLAPPGQGTLAIHCPAYMDYENRWRTGPGMARGEAYRALKDEIAAVLVERVRRAVAPDLARHIVLREAATPVTYWRYTGNREGSIMGYMLTGRNIRARLAHHRTPVRNLFLAGHWSDYGGGVPIAVKAAANVSLLILRAENPAEYRRLGAAMAGVG
jgi:prolycopene isomerase